jgi:SNF2 family DNA or RNA helicase
LNQFVFLLYLFFFFEFSISEKKKFEILTLWRAHHFFLTFLSFFFRPILFFFSFQFLVFDPFDDANSMTSTVATRENKSQRPTTVRFVDISGDDDVDVNTNIVPDEDTVTVMRGRSTTTTDSSTRRIRSTRPSVVVEEAVVENNRPRADDSAEDDLFDSVIPRWRSSGSGNHAVAASSSSAAREIDPSNTDNGAAGDNDVINLMSDDDDDEQEFSTLQELLDEAGIATIVKKTTSNNKNGNDNHHDDDFGSADNRAFKKPRRENGAAGGEPIATVSISDDEDDDFGSNKPNSTPHSASVPPRYRVNSTLEHDSLVPDDAKPYVIDANASPPVVIPAHIACRLHKYQIEGVEFLYRRCFIEDSGAILGDDMGMGKTIQSIAFLSAVLRVGDERRATGYYMSPDSSRPVALVVLPASVILQWDAEIKKWSTLRAAAFQGSERRRALYNIQSRRADVLLISYEMLRTNRELIEDIGWTCIIFDEIHRLKNIHSKLTVECSKLNCKRRVGLTGTVMQNNFEELHGIINFVAPGLLGPYRTFKQWYVDPIVSGQEYSALKSATNNGRHASRRLHAKLQQVMLRRKKELISHELPGKEDNVVFCNLTELQRRLYERALAVPEVTLLRRLVDRCQCGSGNLFGTCCGSSQSVALGGGLVVDWKKEVLRTISRLNNLANHPVLLSPQARDPPEKRERDAVFQAHVLGPDAVAVRTAMLDQNHALLSGKMHVLSALLRRWSADVPRNKVLLFSRSTLTLDMLGGHLARLGILYLRLDGSTTNKRRDQLVAQFQSLDSPQWVFLVSTRAGGLGLNLTAANIVVVFDPNWNHTWDLQAQDRAYRIGQQRYTRVYRFISTGTLEELLYVRQVYKQQFSSIAQEGAKERRFFNRDELFGLRQLLNPVSDVARTASMLERSQPQAERMPSVRPGGAKSAVKSENEPADESFFPHRARACHRRRPAQQRR